MATTPPTKKAINATIPIDFKPNSSISLKRLSLKTFLFCGFLKTNDELARDNKKFMFVTLFLAILDISTGKLIYTNAGHNPSIICRNGGGIELLDAYHGPVAAALPELAYKEDIVFLDKGDLLFIYTDGVTDARNIDKQFFTQDRLENLLNSERLGDAEETVERVFDEVKHFEGKAEQFDDITLMALYYEIASDISQIDDFSVTIPNQLSEITNVNELFNNFIERHSLPTEMRRQFNLVIDELLNNVISYAYEDGNIHHIDINAVLQQDQLTLTVSDDGLPFNPFVGETSQLSGSLEDQSIGGLGIHLVKNLMDKANYQRMVNRNVVKLVKTLK